MPPVVVVAVVLAAVDPVVAPVVAAPPVPDPVAVELPPLAEVESLLAAHAAKHERVAANPSKARCRMDQRYEAGGRPVNGRRADAR